MIEDVEEVSVMALSSKVEALLRTLPAVSSVLECEDVQHWLAELPRASVVAAVQHAIARCREQIVSGAVTDGVDLHHVLALAESDLVRRSIPSLRRVINATGVVLHTGLGRAPLCESAIDALVDGAHGYCSLEFDLATGARGKRNAHLSELLSTLTGAEAGTVVNNNAAATLMILNTFGAEREVVVSRGELVEIGGSYRIPDILRASRAILREVGTTNRTRLSDYESAINDETAILLRVHPSNYRVVGFTESTPVSAISELAHRFGLLAVDDLGSGALMDMKAHGLPDEPCVRDSIEAGADLVCFSGDKLVGGPQSGLIVGKRTLIERIEASPLMRTYRVDKLTLLALDATLRQYLDPVAAIHEVPTLSMLHMSTEVLVKRARKLSGMLKEMVPRGDVYEASDVSYAGGGAMPGQELETIVVHWRPEHASVNDVVAALRSAETPVVARVRDDAICFDMRTVPESDFETLIDSIAASIAETETDDPGTIGLPVV